MSQLIYLVNSNANRRKFPLHTWMEALLLTHVILNIEIIDTCICAVIWSRIVQLSLATHQRDTFLYTEIKCYFNHNSHNTRVAKRKWANKMSLQLQ